MMGNTSPLASDSAGLVGTMLSRMFIIDGDSTTLPLIASLPTMPMPAPGWKMLAKASPIATAKADVSM